MVADQPQNVLTGLPGSKEKPSGPDESWRRIISARAPAFDHSIPAYLLDDNYFFLDWNGAFDELVAAPLGLKRGSHAEDFVRELENVEAVYNRSTEIFDPNNVPLIDLEPLVFRSKKYGEIEFQKIAVQIPNASGGLAAWSVFLNISRADEMEQLWSDLQKRMLEDLNWSLYAISYDKLLLEFDDYHQLLTLICSKLDDCRLCLDLGAGTGTGTLRLLRSRENREVWAVESNHAMIQQLIAKIERAEIDDNQDYFGRLRPLKEDLLRLDDWREFLQPDYFEAAILMNVLYAVRDPEVCLRAAFQLLREGGKVVFSTSHSETNVDKLFARMREVLEEKGVFNALKRNFDSARARHRQMDHLIHRDSKDDIRRFTENAGFEIVDWRDSEYAEAVVVVEALKP